MFFFKSYEKNCSVNHIQKVLKFYEFNSLSHIRGKRGSILWVKEVQFFESYQKKGVQFFQSYFKMGSILWVRFLSRKVGSILWDMFKKWVQFLWIMLNRRVQYCESCWKEWRIQFFESCWTEGFNSLSHFWKKGSIQWIIFFEKLNSVNHVQKGFNYLTHFPKKSIL